MFYIEFTYYWVVIFSSSSVKPEEKKIVCFVTHGIYLYAELVLLGIYCKVGGWSEAFKTSERLEPFLWIAEIENF